MGNTESLLSKQHSNEDLARSAKSDAEILAAIHDISFDDALIIQQYISELEGNTKQFQTDELALNRRKNLKEKWSNAELALAVLDATKSSHFQKKELKYLRREIQTSRDKGIGNFEHILNVRLAGIEKIHAAMIRTHKRLKKTKSKLSSDLEIQKKADFIVNLFSNANDSTSGKLMDHILLRLDELPPYLEISLGLEVTSEKESTEEQSASMETEENTSKTSLFPDFQIGDVDSVRTYEEQFSKSLLFMIINALSEESKLQLGKLNSFSPAQDMSASTAASPPLKLLQILQRNLLYKAACSLKSESEPLWTLLFYAKALLQFSVDILTLAIKVNKSLTNTDSQSLDRRVDMRVQFLLKSSILYHLTFPFCTALCILLNMPEFTKFASEILPILVVLISLVDTVNTYHGESQSAEKYYLERLKLAENACAVEVESPHNYYPNTDEDKVVHIQGATHLTVSFDPRCSTQVGNDFLQLYKQEKHTEPILDAFSGKQENWPKVPIIIQGDTVCFHFHSEAFGSFWGYRCIVTPLILDSSKVWFYDFERTLGFLVGAALDKSVAFPIPKLQEKEKSHHVWLDSQLFHGGLQSDVTETEKIFIEDFINSREGTIASQVLQKIESKLPVNPALEKMGGVTISPAIRAYMLALLKHMGILQSIIETIMQYQYQLSTNPETTFQLNSDVEDQLLKIWQEGRKLRQWIANERRRLLLELEAEDEESKENVNENSNNNTKEKNAEEIEKRAAQKKKLEEKCSYEYFCQMRILLDLTPASNFHITEDFSLDFEDHSKKRKRTQNTPSLRMSQEESPLKTWKDLFNAWQAVQSLSRSQQLKKSNKKSSQEILASVPQLITNFAKTADASSLHEVINLRIARARNRTLGLNIVYELLGDGTKALTLNSVKQDLMSSLSNTLQSLIESQEDANHVSRSHYLSGVKSCGIHLEDNIRNAYFRIISMVLANLKESIDIGVKATGVSLLSDISYLSSEDTSALQQLDVLSILHNVAIDANLIKKPFKPDDMVTTIHSLSLSNNASDYKLREISNLCLRVISYEICNPGLFGIVEASKNRDRICESVIDSLFVDLYRAIPLLYFKRDSSIKKGSTSETTKEVLEYHKQERFVFESLLQLHLTTLHNPTPFTQTTTSEKILKLLLHVQHQATPRLQILSLRILRRILVGVKPAELYSSDWIQFFGELLERKDEKMGIIEYLFEMIGDSSTVTDLDAVLNAPPAQDYRTAQIKFSVAAERTILLRLLFAHAHWQDSIVKYIKDSISGIPKLLSIQDKNLKSTGGINELPHYKRAMAALAVLGGSCVDVIIRTGSRVSVKSTNEKGTVVAVDRLTSSSKLVLDSNINKVISVDLDKLQPLPEVEIDPSSFVITKDLIQAFTVFTNNFKNTEKKTTPPPPEPVKPPVKKAVPKSKPPSSKKPLTPKPTIPRIPLEPWACVTCTFINDAASISCAICNSTRPRLGNSLVESQVPPEPWICSFCTLQNEAYASVCAVCTAARPPPIATTAPSNPTPVEPPVVNEPAPEAMEIETSLSASAEKEIEPVVEDVPVVPEVKEIVSNIPLVPEVPVDLLLHQIRSAALKSIAHLMQGKENSQILVNEGLFANLLNMAVQPSQLDEFKSVLQLEMIEERLYELIYHKKNSIEEESVQKLVQSEYLKHSPFSKLPLILPSVLDRSSAKRVAFPDGDLTGVIWAKHASDMDYVETNIGLARGNHLIPVSIPVYYFEVEIQSKSEIKSTDGLTIAIGLYREGCALDGLPGNSNSYAYQGDLGQLCHNVGSLRASRVVEREFGPSFTHGDVVGCGWNIKTKELFFTKNGTFLGNGFDNVNGRFYPVVWIGAENTKVTVNFGQKPFVFDVMSVLPEDFLQSISDMEQKTKVMSDTEIKRSTKADELVVMMDIFPKELCVIALERCHDDMQYAANWLIENGFKELERMANETITKTERENREEMEKRIMEQVIEDQKALGQISGDVTVTAADVLSGQQTTSDEPSDDFDEGVLDSREPAARFLDDEIGADVPVQVERQNARVEIQEELKLEDVSYGMLLHVSGSVDFDIMDLSGKTGLAQEIDINNLRVKLRFLNPETASVHSVWVPFQQLKKPRSMWQDPAAQYRLNKVEDLKRSVEEIETALSILKIRKTILNLLPVWPADVFKNLTHNWQSIIDLLKLAGAENLCVSSELKKVKSSNNSSINSQKSALDVFYDKLAIIIKEESGIRNFGALRLPEIEGISSAKESTGGGVESITQLLTEECIKHLTLAVKAPLPVVVEESAHPYQNHQDIRKGFHIKGAQKLMIQFDPRCNVHRTDLLTRVAFYRDSGYEDLVAFYRGPVGNNMFETIMVDSDKIYFRFTSGAGETFWGYKFTVIPINLRLNDSQALQGLNFEMGYWLLELLLEHGSEVLRTNYIKHLYDALIYYIQNSKRSAKSRGVQLLLRILTEIQQAQVYQLIDLDKLKSARKLMEKTYSLERQQNKLVFSAHLQRLTELVAMTRLMEIQQKTDQNLNKDFWKKFWSQSFPEIRLKIVEAKYGNLKSGKEAILTDAFQQIVEKEHGGGYLFIPSSFSQFPLLSAVSGSKSNQLSITYQFIDILSGFVVDSGQKVSSNGESYTLRPDTWFESITNVIEIIDQISRRNRIPEQIILEALYSKKLREELYIQVISEYKANSNQAGTAKPSNKILQSASEFTFYFWIYIEEDTGSAKARSLIVKGNEVTGTRGPAVMLEAGKVTLKEGKRNTQSSIQRNVILQVGTSKNAIEQVETSNEIQLKQWTHIACVYDGKKMRIYVNGLLDGEVGLKGRILMNNDPFYINKVPVITQNPDSVCDGVKGIFRDFCFKMKALSTEQIQILLTSYIMSDPQPQPPPNPLELSQEDIAYVQKVVGSSNLGIDEQLVELVSGMFDDADRDAMYVPTDSLIVNQEMLGRYPKLSQFCSQYSDFLKELRLRFEAIRIFNTKLSQVLPLIDFSQSHLPWTLAHKLIKLKGIILMSTKQQLWGKILSNTMSGRGRTSVQINRPRAMKAKEKGDPEGTRSVFGQLFRQIHFVHPSALRKPGQAWSVTYLGEGGQDAGGLFRDSISHVCSDLQSPYVPLFIPCPNSRGFGDNQDKWVPIPSATSSLQLAMFAFVGKLMGVAIRGKHSLNLNLPSIVWKQLVGSEITRADLEAIDTFSYKIYDQVMNAESQEITPETFSELNLTFSVTSTDGKDIELIENGKNIKVTWENRQHYIKLVENYRLNEFKTQVEAIKSGLGTIVPNQLLSLFNWQELEMNVCGRSDINLDLLKQNTKYSGYSRTDPVVGIFWDVLGTFSAKEKELFLRFVWGRSRLPLRSEDFDQKFVLMTSPENSDEVLPLSHTCFFQLELPRYSSRDILHKKLLYAITECREIDTDHAAQNVDWDREDENENNNEDED